MCVDGADLKLDQLFDHSMANNERLAELEDAIEAKKVEIESGD